MVLKALKAFIQDESGFLNFLLPAIGPIISAITSLFGGAPGEEDLMQGTRDNLKLDLDAKKQGQDLRGDANTDIKALKNISTANARKVGAFNPTNLGPEFDFLQKTVSQFDGVDRSAAPLMKAIMQTMQLAQLSAAAGAGGTSGALGAEQLLANAGSVAGQGVGQGLSDIGGLIGGGLLSKFLSPGSASGGGGGLGDFFKNFGFQNDPGSTVNAEFDVSLPSAPPPSLSGNGGGPNDFFSQLLQGNLNPQGVR